MAGGTGGGGVLRSLDDSLVGRATDGLKKGKGRLIGRPVYVLVAEAGGSEESLDG